MKLVPLDATLSRSDDVANRGEAMQEFVSYAFLFFFHEDINMSKQSVHLSMVVDLNVFFQ